MLLEAGADPTEPNTTDGETPLSTALRSSKRETVCELLKAPYLEINALSPNDGMSHLELAKESGDRLYDILLAEHANRTSDISTFQTKPEP